MILHRGQIMQHIISLLTDFGLTDSYVSEMKATILAICPTAVIVDITHLVDKFDVRAGAFLLAEAAPSFPKGTIHLAIIDPGVGSERRPILIETRRSLFIGPDNGLLMPAAINEGLLHVYQLTNTAMMRGQISSTFHGRDIFAPVAAHLASGASLVECGPEITDYSKSRCAQPVRKGSGVTVEVIHIDSFGNVISNLSTNDALKPEFRHGKKISLLVGRHRISAIFVKTYSDLKPNQLGALIGSHGFLELACRESSAAKRIRARKGSLVRVYGV